MFQDVEKIIQIISCIYIGKDNVFYFICKKKIRLIQRYNKLVEIMDFMVG